MSMKISRIFLGGEPVNIFSLNDEWFSVNKYSHLEVRELFPLLDEIKNAIKSSVSRKIDVDPDKELLPPVIGSPGKIIGVGLNYMEHINETGKTKTNDPIFFSKFHNALAGHNEKIQIKPEWNVDYEGELGVIIGKRTKDVEIGKAYESIGGFFISNDLSARRLQYLTSQYLLGKTPDKFFPNGPKIVTYDEIEDFQNLNIRTFVNGELRQNGNTSQMIFNIPYLISYLSKVMTLNPGDVISTGTPSGVIAGMPEDKRIWLKNNDKIEIEIEGIGILRNWIVAI